MEKAIFYVDELVVTQEMNGNYSHNGDLAIDISSAAKNLRAPFAGIIKRIYTNCNAVWLESKEKVEFADGTKDYMTIMTLHDNDVSNLKVGQEIKQGTIYFQPGNKGISTGSHIHIAVGKGKFKGTGWYKGQYQPKVKSYAWLIYNQYDITKALFIDKRVKQTKPFYNWKIATEETTISYYPKYTGKSASIVEALKSLKIDSSYSNRTKVANKNGISNYKGSASQNTQMLNLLKQGKLIKV